MLRYDMTFASNNQIQLSATNNNLTEKQVQCLCHCAFVPLCVYFKCKLIRCRCLNFIFLSEKMIFAVWKPWYTTLCAWTGELLKKNIEYCECAPCVTQWTLSPTIWYDSIQFTTWSILESVHIHSISFTSIRTEEKQNKKNHFTTQHTRNEKRQLNKFTYFAFDLPCTRKKAKCEEKERKKI